ncbi:Ig-like domain-containing protein [Vibrio harveyi]
MSLGLTVFRQISQFFLLLTIGAMLVACDSGGDSFLDKGIDAGAKDIVSTQLVIGGQTESITLSPGQEVSIAVRVTYEDGSVVYLDPSDVAFEYERSLESASNSEGPPFVVDGFVLKVPAHMNNEDVTVIAVYQGSRTMPVMVQVRDKVIDHLQLTPSESLLIKGARALFRLEAFYADGSSARLASDVLAGEWQVSDVSVVSIDVGEGYFEALGVGQALISYELNGHRSNEVAVKVSGEMVTAINVTPTQLEIAKGATGDVRAMATLSDGSKLDITSSVSWSEHSAVSVDSRGLVVGVSEQANVPLVAVFNGVQSNSVSVTVKGADISALVLSPSNTTVNLSEQGRSLSLVAQYTDGSALPYSDVTGVVYTPDSDIVHIDANGVIHPKSEGVAVVSAKAQDRHGHWVESNSIALSVIASPLVGITIHADSTSVPQGVFTTLRAMGEYVDGRVEDITSQAHWQSSEPSTLTIADGVAYGASAGQVEVTAYLDGVLSDSVQIDVVDVELTALAAYFTTPKADADGVVVLPLGLHAQALAVASFSDGSVHMVTDQATWHSSDDAIASVSPGGVFAGQAKGDVSGYASFSVGGITKESGKNNIKVTDATPVRLDVLPSKVSLVKGLNHELHAVATYSDGHFADVTSASDLSWTTQDSSVATLTQSSAGAQVLGVSVGDTTAKVTWSGLDAYAQVAVEEKALTGIVLNPITQTLAKGAKGQMQVFGLYSDNTQQDITSSVTNYRSNDNNVAIVDTYGEVSALASGSAVLTVSYDGFESKAQLIVPEAKVTSLRIGGVSSINAGTTQNLSATAVFDDGSELDVTSAANWQSSASNVIVDSGSVWARDDSNANVTITASFNGQQAQKALTITSATLSSLSLSPNSIHIVEGATQSFTLEATYSDGNTVPVSDQATWASSNNVIAGFIPNTNTLTASAPGDITVTATFGGLSAESKVYITDRAAAVDTLRVDPVALTLPAGGSSSIKVEASYASDPTTFVDVTAQTTWQLDTDFVVISDGIVIARQASSSPLIATAIYGGKQVDVTLTLSDAAVERLQLSANLSTLAKGHSTQLIASAFFTNGLVMQPSPDDITWEIESGSGVTVNDSGVATATAPNESAVIKATYQGQSATTVITTNDATLHVVLLTDHADAPLKHSMLLAKGMTVDSKLRGQFSDGVIHDLDPSKVTYTITGDAAAQHAGVLSAVKEGLSDITASYTDNGQVFTSQVVTMAVSGANVASIAITSGDVTLVEGMSTSPKAIAMLTDGTSLDVTSSATWTVADDSIAQFEQGALKGRIAGQTTFVASFYGQSATAKVTVNDMTLTRLSMSPSVVTVTVGQTQAFSATAHFDNGISHALNTEVDWTLDNAIATIDGNGQLTAVSAGTVNVTATLRSDPSQQVQAAVTIIERSVKEVRIKLTESSIASGQSTSVTATVVYTDNTSDDVTHQALWGTSEPDVALVNGGYIRGLKPGRTNIQATFRGVTSTTQTLVVSGATVTLLQLSPAKVTLAKGYDASLVLTATYSDGTTAVITPADAVWAVSSGDGVMVDRGIVTATEEGKTAMIEATYQGESTTSTVTTTSAAMDGITLLDDATNTPLASVVLPIGSKQGLKVIGRLSDGHEQPLTSGVRYYSSDDTVAAINGNGEVSAKAEGSAVITATYAGDGNIFTSNKTIINVTNAAVQSIAIVPDFNPVAYRIAGLEYNLDVQATLTDGSTRNVTSLVTWKSVDESIANISNAAHGTLEAKKGGETDVTAHYASLSDTLTVKVMDASLTSLEVTPSNDSLSQGSTKQYQAIGLFNNGTEIDVTDQVSWSVAPSSVATIDTAGLVTAVSTGSATITATKGSISKSAPLTVTDKAVASIQISANSTSLPEGQYTPLTAVVNYTDGTQDVNGAQYVLWVSSEPLQGVVRAGEFYALSKGDTELTATFRGVVSKPLTMNVSDARLSALQLTPVSSTVAAGEEQHYVLMGMYTDGQSHEVTDLANWSVTEKDGSATTIASTTHKGIVNTNATGDVKVTATIGSLSAEAELNITSRSVVRVVFNQGQDIILNKGDVATPGVTVIYSDNSSESIDSANNNLTFHTTNAIPTIAEFDTTTKGQLNTLHEGKTEAWVSYQIGADTHTSTPVDVVVTGKTVSSIVFTQVPSALPKGTQGSFVLEATYSDSTTAIVTDNATWTSSDVTKATVLKGVVTASDTNEGDSTIEANYEGQSITHTVTVSGAALTHLTLDAYSLQVHQGLTQSLTLTAHYSDGSSSTQTSTATWQSSADSVATVSAGMVSAVAEGETTITATLSGQSVSAKVFVLNRKLDRIAIVLANDTFKVGESQSITVNAYYEGATGVPVDVTDQVAWQSTNNHAIVFAGSIVGRSEGTDTITAKLNGKEGSKDIEVKGRLIKMIKLNFPHEYLEVGQVYAITITGYDYFGESFPISSLEPYLEFNVYKDDSKTQLSDAFTVTGGLLEVISSSPALLEVRIPASSDLTAPGWSVSDQHKLDSFKDPFVVELVGLRTSPHGEEYGAAGDSVQVKAIYQGEDVSDKVTLSLGTMGSELFSISSDTLNMLYVPDTSGDEIGSGKYGAGSLTVSYDVGTSTQIAKVFDIYNVGRAVDSLEIHQFFPEPITDEAEADTTKLVIAEDMGRQFFVTVTYSDGVSETTRNTDLSTLNSSSCRGSINPISFLRNKNKDSDWLTFVAVRGASSVGIGSYCNSAHNSGFSWGFLRPEYLNGSPLVPGEVITVGASLSQDHNSPDIGSRGISSTLELSVVSVKEYQNATSLISTVDHLGKPLFLAGAPTYKDLLDMGASESSLDNKIDPSTSIIQFTNLGDCEDLSINKFGLSAGRGSSKNADMWLKDSGTNSAVPTFVMTSKELREAYLGLRFSDITLVTNKWVSGEYKTVVKEASSNYNSSLWISDNVARANTSHICLVCPEGKSKVYDRTNSAGIDHYSLRCD